MIICLGCLEIGSLPNNFVVGLAARAMPIKEPFIEKLPLWQADGKPECRVGPVFEKCKKL
jgi:hypothetical protein